MKKLVRSTYPPQFSAGLLLLIFVISYFLSHQIFEVPLHALDENTSVYFGMFLVSMAVIVMLLIIWEEFLFPIKVKEVNGGMLFRNHRTKLKTQLLIYSVIPAIFVYIYYTHEVNKVRFFIWAAICIIAPVIEKIASGINNFNDFLKLTDDRIEYKNNQKEGSFETEKLRNIIIVRNDRDGFTKIQLVFNNGDSIIIDLDEMELDAYLEYIYDFITTRYPYIVKESTQVLTANSL